MSFTREDIRNVAIIAHVDHGKTTIVDTLLRQSGTFRVNESLTERVMDSNDLERERGITILSKNTAILYKDVKINIVDTPGHADFGGEVERVLKMVDSVLLVVDAYEGPMPQTRFVLKKALELGLKPIVCINKIDRPDQRVTDVLDEIYYLFIDLGCNESQLEFPVVYASAKAGIAKYNLNDESSDMIPLFETLIKEVKAPTGDLDASLQMLITTIEYDEYVGRVAVGRIFRGRLKVGQNTVLCGPDGNRTARVNKIFTFMGLKRIETADAYVGDIIAISGIDDINIGETLADALNPEALPFIAIEEPTISMTFSVNNSPFAGKEGDFVTSRHLRARLMKELETNVALRVEDTETPDTLKVSGRGELHLSILIETMRRQGYEFQVSKPAVIYKEIAGRKCEPIEQLMIDVPEEYVGSVMEKLGSRKAEMVNMSPTNDSFTRIEFTIPSRGLIGYRSQFMTDTKGTGVMNHMILDFQPYKGDIPVRTRGSLVASESGESSAYGLFNAQERGELFIGAAVQLYEGMVVGENAKSDDIEVNVCKRKHVTNMRASGTDESLKLTSPIEMSLEQCLEFIESDEWVEITPKSIRIRKKILDTAERIRSNKRNK